MSPIHSIGKLITRIRLRMGVIVQVPGCAMMKTGERSGVAYATWILHTLVITPIPKHGELWFFRVVQRRLNDDISFSMLL